MELWIHGSVGPVDLQSLWIHRAHGSTESMDLQSPWICRACGSMEPVDLQSGASHIGVVDPVEPVLILLISLYKNIIGIINLDSKSINSCK